MSFLKTLFLFLPVSIARENTRHIVKCHFQINNKPLKILSIINIRLINIVRDMLILKLCCLSGNHTPLSILYLNSLRLAILLGDMHNLIIVCTPSMMLFNSSTVCAESHNLDAIAKSAVNVLLLWRLLQSRWKRLSAEESGVVHSGYNKTHTPLLCWI